MKITDVQAFLLSYAMPEPIRLPFYNGERTIFKRDALFIKVSTDVGITGFAPGPAHQPAQKNINEIIRPLLLGKSLKEIRRESLPLQGSALNDFGSVEFALFDLKAKSEGVPLHQVLGGKLRNSIKLYGSAGMYMPPEAYAGEAAAIKEMGFTAYKMRPALGPEGDLKTVELMRKATGADFCLMIDAHAWWRMGDKNYPFETIVDLSREMAGYNPFWLEEPLPPEDHDAYRRLKKLNLLPIASGEHEHSESGFFDLIFSGAVDYVQMDAFCQGGFATAQKIFKKVEEANLKFAYHSWGTTLEVLVAAHLGICWSESVVEWLEYPCYSHGDKPGMYPFPLADEILKYPPETAKGYLKVPDEPGIGIEVNESVVEKYPFIPGPWSVFEIYSPPEKIAVTGDHSIKWVDEGDI